MHSWLLLRHRHSLTVVSTEEEEVEVVEVSDAWEHGLLVINVVWFVSMDTPAIASQLPLLLLPLPLLHNRKPASQPTAVTLDTHEDIGLVIAE